MLMLACVVCAGWLLASTFGTWAYLAGNGSLERSLARKI